MISLGLIGYPLGHSLSPQLHAAALRACGLEGEYSLREIPPEDNAGLRALMEQMRLGDIQGLNVTIPHKQAIMQFLDELSPSARSIGAVNTISWKDQQLLGDNTDAPGFLSSLKRGALVAPSNKTAIVLGAGGAARAVVYALLSEGWTLRLAIRRADEDQAAQLMASMETIPEGHLLPPVFLEAATLGPTLEHVSLVVNSTPVGMHPDAGSSPWPVRLRLPGDAIIYDLVYNPRETAFLRQARGEGRQGISGIGMLVEQAALSFEIWTGHRPPREAMISVVEVR